VLKDEKVYSVMSQFSILELLISLPSLFHIKKDNQTVESYYSKIVGKKNYRKFFQYIFNAVPSQSTNDFPANILFKKRKRRKDILKSFTFRQGIRSIIEAISDLPEIDTLYGNAVASVTRKNGSFLVTLDKEQYFESEFFALATPVNITADLTEKLNPDLSQILTRIGHVQTDSVGVVIKKELLEFKEVAGIIGIDTNFYSVVSRDVVEDENHRGFVFHFKPGTLENQAKIDYICQILGISEKDLTQTFFKQNTVPSFKVGHESITEEIDKMLQNEKILITGNFISGMAIEDCVSRSKAEFTRLQNFRK
jgi:protoporphyrinogen oxidase